MDRIGVGLIGTGYMGKCHALAWNAVRSVFGDVPAPRLVHLAEANQTLAERQASAFGFEKATDDWRKLISDPEVDIVSVTTPNRFHAEMAITALEAGKHVWCEKPMAPALADAERMAEAARRSGRLAALGYNYIQNPMMRQIAKLLKEDRIGTVNHVRIEMDEDFMADSNAPYSWRNEKTTGYGALDDFAVHPLSLLQTLLGNPSRVMCDMARPYPERPDGKGGRKAVENHDIANVLFRIGDGISGTLQVNRAAWGRKGRIALQIYGSKGSILYDQERLNEMQLYLADDKAGEQGFRTIFAAPQHPPYDKFIPAPGHGIGFNELKIIECRQILGKLKGEDTLLIDFDHGLAIERAVHAMARSFESGKWERVG